MKNNILIIAGEPSGDIHAAKLLKELRALMPNTTFWGIGGDAMIAEGFEVVEHIKNLSIVGVWEVITKVPQIRRQMSLVTKESAERRPDAVILVDYPGFNLNLARKFKSMEIPVLYYIIPQVWAWGKGRIKDLKNFTDKTFVLFDFEERLLRENGVNCKFVGHPLMDHLYEGDPLSKGKEISIALLPGSRKNEILKLLPVMMEAARQIAKYKDSSFILAESSNIPEEMYSSILREYGDVNITPVRDNAQKALVSSDFAIVTSGTATLEAAITGTPMLITYKTAPLTAFLFFNFVRLEYIGLVNFIAEKKIVPELLQEKATGLSIAKETLAILNDPDRIDLMKSELKQVRDSLGEPGASARAAVEMKSFLDNYSSSS